MAYVYRHIRLDKNEPFYIGIGSDSEYKRAYERTRRNEIWRKITTKTKYEVEILIDDIDFVFAKVKEKEFIQLYGRIDLRTGGLANMTDGGDGTLNKIVGVEYRAKLSAAAKKRIIPPEQRKKIGESRRGKKFTIEQKKKVSDAVKGRKLTKAHVQLMSERMTVNNPMKGMTGQLCLNTKVKVIAFKEGVEIGEYFGMYDAARSLDLNASKINAVLKGRRNHTKGYTFKSIPI